jgi:hypothetical protein
MDPIARLFDILIVFGLMTPSTGLSHRSVTLGASDTSHCYIYARDTVTLVGELIWRVYAGRPNYESVESGDQPDTVAVFRLATQLCLTASKDFDAQDSVRELQLIIPFEDFRWVIQHPGLRKTLTGTLSGWVWGWHHLPVLFDTHLPRPQPASRRS